MAFYQPPAFRLNDRALKDLLGSYIKEARCPFTVFEKALNETMSRRGGPFTIDDVRDIVEGRKLLSTATLFLFLDVLGVDVGQFFSDLTKFVYRTPRKGGTE